MVSPVESQVRNPAVGQPCVLVVIRRASPVVVRQCCQVENLPSHLLEFPVIDLQDSRHRLPQMIPRVIRLAHLHVSQVADLVESRRIVQVVDPSVYLPVNRPLTPLASRVCVPHHVRSHILQESRQEIPVIGPLPLPLRCQVLSLVRVLVVIRVASRQSSRQENPRRPRHRSPLFGTRCLCRGRGEGRVVLRWCGVWTVLGM